MQPSEVKTTEANYVFKTKVTQNLTEKVIERRRNSEITISLSEIAVTRKKEVMDRFKEMIKE
jgi:hypothetical protein